MLHSTTVARPVEAVEVEQHGGRGAGQHRIRPEGEQVELRRLQPALPLAGVLQRDEEQAGCVALQTAVGELGANDVAGEPQGAQIGGAVDLSSDRVHGCKMA